APAPVVAATRVTLTGPDYVRAVVSPDMLRLALLGKVVTGGDDVSLLPQDVVPGAAANGQLLAAARASLRNTVGMSWTSALLAVVTSPPASAALVTMDTVVGWQHDQETHSTATPVVTAAPETRSGPTSGSGFAEVPVVTLEELPGVRDQADQLLE